MPEIKKVYREYGLDFDNNKYGLGRSTEIEYTDDTEIRTHEKIRINTITGRYMRIWIGKIVIVIDADRPYISFHKKKRWNIKIVYGISGK